MTAWTTTSWPSSSTPAASQPRIIGSASSRSPTPRSDHRSWWLSAAALTVTVVHPSGTSGSGRSPTTRPDSGSSEENVSAYTANMRTTLAAGSQGTSGSAGSSACLARSRASTVVIERRVDQATSGREPRPSRARPRSG